MMSLKKLTGMLLALLMGITLWGQECNKSKIFSKEVLGDFDYKGQSSFAVLSSGDTARVKIVVYANQQYRIMAGGEPTLGALQFRLIDEVKRFQKEVKEIKENEVPVYKVDQDGNPILNEWGEYIVDRNEIQYDTVWMTKKYIDRNEIFNSGKSSGSAYWENLVKKTRVYTIEVIIPKTTEPVEGCVQIMVGFKVGKKKASFKPN